MLLRPSNDGEIRISSQNKVNTILKKNYNHALICTNEIITVDIQPMAWIRSQSSFNDPLLFQGIKQKKCT
jgi:hypothetical protein